MFSPEIRASTAEEAANGELTLFFIDKVEIVSKCDQNLLNWCGEFSLSALCLLREVNARVHRNYKGRCSAFGFS